LPISGGFNLRNFGGTKLHITNACVDFIKEVFAEPFANTEESTILKKLSGPDKMLEIIDTYWEAQGIKVEKTRLFPKK